MIGEVLITDIAVPQHGALWDHKTPDTVVNEAMAWQGHKDVLARQPGELIVASVNCNGKAGLVTPMGQVDHKSRLIPAAALVAAGHIDIVAVVDVRLDEAGLANANIATGRMESLQHRDGKIGIVGAPSSESVTEMEYINLKGREGRVQAGGIVLLMSPALRLCIRSTQHFHSGRLLHVELLIDGRVVHILAFYGVSACTKTLQKERLQRDIQSTLQRILRSLAGQRVICMGDLNSAARPEDRDNHGERYSYDRSNLALWRSLQEGGFIDSHKETHPVSQHMTFRPAGRGVSRIDAIWASANMPAANRTAVSKNTAPLSSDHATVCATFGLGLRLDKKTAEGQVSVVSAITRPRRVNFTEERQERFRAALDSSTLAADRDKFNACDPDAWSDIARALDDLEMPALTLTKKDVAENLRKAIDSRKDDESSLRQSAQVLNRAMGQHETVDLSDRREAVLEAAGQWVADIACCCRTAWSIAATKKEQVAAVQRRKRHSLSQALSACRWLDSQPVEAWGRGRRQTDKDMLERISLLHEIVSAAGQHLNFALPLPSLRGQHGGRSSWPDRAVWLKWAHAPGDGIQYLERITAGASQVVLPGKGRQLRNKPATWAIPRTPANQLKALGGQGGGGRVMGLLIDVDEKTGQLLPVTDPKRLSGHIQSSLQQLGHEKGHGQNAYGFTAAAHTVLFLKQETWRGNVVARIRSARDCAIERDKMVECLGEWERCLKQLTTVQGILGVREDVTATLHLYQPATVRAAAQFFAGSPSDQDTVAKLFHSAMEAMPRDSPDGRIAETFARCCGVSFGRNPDMNLAGCSAIPVGVRSDGGGGMTPRQTPLM
jgi:exonuclease III